MGAQQSNPKSVLTSQTTLPEPGYRITNLDPSINAKEFKLNIMTDYVVGSDPRFIDLKKLHQQGQTEVEFDVFSILDYRIRKVFVPIQNHQVQSSSQGRNSQNQVQIVMEEEKIEEITLESNKQFTLGINFKLYPNVNDTILRISKVFKNSPLQTVSIKKDEYIVGMIEGDFNSMKSFVDLVKLLIHSQFEYITLAICNSEGITRLQKISVKELDKWKQNYGVGYLGVELAEGWLNKWQLKKHIDANKKKQLNSIQKKVQKKLIQEKQKSKTQESKTTTEMSIQEAKEEVDFSKQSYTFSLQKQKPQSEFKQPNKSQILTENNSKVQEPTLQLSLKSKSDLDESNQEFKDSKGQKPQKISEFSKQSSTIQQIQDSTSELSSNQIDQKCNELQQGNFDVKRKDMNVIKKSKNIVEINFKDDASTICMCKDYSKHCQKCFKEKQGNYLFFNKKTNRIVLIEKAMLFPKKN